VGDGAEAVVSEAGSTSCRVRTGPVPPSRSRPVNR